jgi:plasmid stabilization system protein ParE
MRITFDPRASDDLDRIFEWIAKDRPSAAYAMITRIEEQVASLATPGFAHLGRPGLVEGARELVEPRTLLSIGLIELAERLLFSVSCMVPGTASRA